MSIEEFFGKNNKVAIAFSGGVDSAYLLYEAVRCKADVTAYYVKTQFQPQFEYDDAMKLAEELKSRVKVIEKDVLSCKQVTDNPSDRCYYCKRVIFEAILEAAEADGYTVILDGTNASDDEGDRPGIRALRELQVKSPLRECGLTKSVIRSNSKEAGLFTWDKPAYACLATRIPTGMKISSELLEKTEIAEDYLFGLGFSDFRVRTTVDGAKLQFPQGQFEEVIRRREEIVNELKKYYKTVVLDLEVRK